VVVIAAPNMLHLELIEAWNRFREDDSLSVAVMTGVGDKAYSTGIRGSREEFDCTTLRVRVSNAITGVRYCGRRETCPSADATGCVHYAAPEAARRAATLMVDTLTRQGRS